MKSLIMTIATTLGMVAPAFAASGDSGTASSLLIILFLGFAAIIVVFQFIPGLVLLYSMLKGLFTPASKNVAAGHGRK